MIRNPWINFRTFLFEFPASPSGKDRVPCNRVAYDDEKRFEPSFLKSQAWVFLVSLWFGFGESNFSSEEKVTGLKLQDVKCNLQYRCLDP